MIDEKNKTRSNKVQRDPMLEKDIIVMKGLSRRCTNRVLIELTLSCPSKCEHCCRRWQAETNNFILEKKDIDQICKYIKDNSEINEVILSGGEPLSVPSVTIYALSQINKLEQITVIRVHTRIPVTHPELLSKEILAGFYKIKNKALYISIHVNHPDELSKKTIGAVRKIQKSGGIMYSQTVFLKGINDSVETLKKLFTRLLELGIRPYYIYRCLLIEGMEHLVVPFEKEVEIMTKLRNEISGLAFPFHIIGANKSGNKIPIPLDIWNFDKSNFTDFNGNILKIADTELV